jgi:hypothetical protein
MNIISNGGERGNFPSHILPGVMAAYVQGADYIKLKIQSCKDNQIVAFENDDLEESTDGKGMIQDFTWAEIRTLDAGFKFKKGADLPWKKIREPYEFDVDRKNARATIPSLENILKQMPADSKYILEICFDNDQLSPKLKVLNSLLSNHDQKNFILLFNKESEIIESRNIFKGNLTVDKIGLVISSTETNFTSKPDILYFKNTPPQYPPGDYIIETESVVIKDEKAWGICHSSLLQLNESSYNRIYFEEKFSGKSLNREFWYSGISSGFEQHARYLFDAANQRRLVTDSRKEFDTRLFVDDGLIIDIKEGYQYASAGVISRIPLKGNFAIEVDWTFLNPQRATQMAVGFRNSDIFSTHQAPFNKNGEVVKTKDSDWVDMWEVEHQFFDTHGGPPFVMIEHEEKDGNRLCSNRVNSGFFRWYNNFYFPNVGDGSANEGTFRLQRHGKLFSAYYKDKHNQDWVGISAVENESMNESLYLTLGAKHYPKREAPGILPSNHVTYKNVKIYKPNK